jgi:hypothetical protein
VVSIAGKTSLIELTGLLRACALYIGNDSGPKHIAAGLGVPTLGIHSGVVDAVEWAPLGGRAMALRRNMTCAPCYLANAEDCPRALACLRFLEPAFVYQAAQALLARPVAAVAPALPTPSADASDVPTPAAAENGAAPSPATASGKARKKVQRRQPAERITA